MHTFKRLKKKRGNFLALIVCRLICYTHNKNKRKQKSKINIFKTRVKVSECSIEDIRRENTVSSITLKRPILMLFRHTFGAFISKRLCVFHILLFHSLFRFEMNTADGVCMNTLNCVPA